MMSGRGASKVSTTTPVSPTNYTTMSHWDLGFLSGATRPCSYQPWQR